MEIGMFLKAARKSLKLNTFNPRDLIFCVDYVKNYEGNKMRLIKFKFSV